jgi:hypothetical protein
MSTPYCASNSANDTAAGSGARTITVRGINTSFAAFSETVTMNGTSSVNLATASVLLINSIEVATADTGGVNAGIIQCGTGVNTAGDPAVSHAYLPVTSATAIPAAGVGGGNISHSFIYGVPANKTLVCRNIQAGTMFATGATSAMQVAIDGYTNASTVFKRYLHLMMHDSASNPVTVSGLIKIPEKTIVIGKLAGSGSNVGPASLSAECLLIDAVSANANQTLF